jgi:uncharacterized protein YukE
MSVDAGMVVRRLCLSSLLVLSTGLFAQQSADQSLGDVARQARAERGQSGRRVFTNDDLAGAPQADAAELDDSADADGQPSQTAAAKAAASGAAEAKAKEDEAKKEAEVQKRAEEVNKRYTEKIAGIRTQIATAKQDLEKLQRDQMESTNQYRISDGTGPSASEYQDQQRQFQQQMETQRTLIASLSTQLEDAQEAARHAGVRTGD